MLYSESCLLLSTSLVLLDYSSILLLYSIQNTSLVQWIKRQRNMGDTKWRPLNIWGLWICGFTQVEACEYVEAPLLHGGQFYCNDTLVRGWLYYSILSTFYYCSSEPICSCWGRGEENERGGWLWIAEIHKVTQKNCVGFGFYLNLPCLLCLTYLSRTLGWVYEPLFIENVN